MILYIIPAVLDMADADVYLSTAHLTCQRLDCQLPPLEFAIAKIYTWILHIPASIHGVYTVSIC